MLDVGPQMSEYLVHVRKSLFLLAESKVRAVHGVDDCTVLRW